MKIWMGKESLIFMAMNEGKYRHLVFGGKITMKRMTTGMTVTITAIIDKIIARLTWRQGIWSTVTVKPYTVRPTPTHIQEKKQRQMIALQKQNSISLHSG